MYTRQTLHTIFDSFSRLKVLVIGEVGIDTYLWGRTRRISPEAPVPIVEVYKETCRIGLSGNVSQNIASLGGEVTFITLLGSDREKDQAYELMAEAHIQHIKGIIDPSRPTLKKVRVISQTQHVVRLDYEEVHPINKETLEKVQKEILHALKDKDCLIIEDYGKGFWTKEALRFAIEEANKLQIPIYVDPSPHTDLAYYRGITLMTPNIRESESLTHFKAPPSHFMLLENSDYRRQHLTRLLHELSSTLETQEVIITCSEWGMVALSKNEFIEIPTYAKKVYDVTGAGDTVIAVIAMMQSSGFSLKESMEVANIAAGLVVNEVGAVSITKNQLYDILSTWDGADTIRS